MSSSKSKKFVKQPWGKIMTEAVAEKMSWRRTDKKTCVWSITIAVAIRQTFVHENGGDEKDFIAASNPFFQFAKNRIKIAASGAKG